MTMRHLDLFSGIGGFALAASWVWGEDHEIVSFCEIEDYPQRVLKKHWPDVPCHGDIKTLKGDSFGAIDLITGGFPCQDISVAGNQKGIKNGTRSGLWFEMLRLIGDLRPKFVIVENVSAILVCGFDTVLGDLAEIGYNAEWQVLSASAFSAPHERERMFLVAFSCEIPGEFSFFPNSKHEIQVNKEWSSTENIKSGRGWQRWLNKVSFALDGPITESDFSSVDDGIPKGLGGYGNAIVPQCVVPIMQAIKEATK